MATLNEIKEFFNENYKVLKDDGNKVLLNVDNGAGGSHHLFVINDQDNRLELLGIIGEIATEDLPEVLKQLYPRNCGGLVRLDNRYIVRHTMYLGDISAPELRAMVRAVATVSFELEQKFVGGVK